MVLKEHRKTSVMILILGAILLGANIHAQRLWYAVPLVIVISLVYAATRHERMKPILLHAGRFSLWIVGFMLLVFLVLFVLTAWL